MPVTSIVLTADDGGDVAHVVFVGTEDDYQFDLDEFFEHLDVIEGYRLGDRFRSSTDRERSLPLEKSRKFRR